jgi:isoleucyl-tRNA synthetase
MSKSLRNYPDPMGVFDTHGADAMRWYLLSSSILRGSDFAVTEEGIRDTVRQVMLPIWNSWYFLTLYANAAGKQGRVRTDSTNVVDRYIFAKLNRTVGLVTRSMDTYDLFEACQQIREFLDALTNWYIRRSRDRFWAGDSDAIDTLHTVMSVLCRLAAPLLPLVSEHIYRGLTGERSVHLADWPRADEVPADDALVTTMDRVRDVCSTTLSLRKSKSRRVRLPLASLTVAAPNATALEEFSSIITDEVNARAVTFRADVAGVAREELQVIPAALGPRLGANTQKVIGAVKRGDWSKTDGGVQAGGVELEPHEYVLKLVADTAGNEDAASAALGDGDGVVIVDLTLTDDLIAEGTARDIVRAVQQARRDAGLDVSDRISLTLGLDEETERRVNSYLGYISGETLATSLAIDGALPRTIATEDVTIGVALERLP